MGERAEGPQIEVPPTGGEPDVVLDIPDATIGKVEAEVENLDATLSLHTTVANFLKLEAGVEAHASEVMLTVKEVGAEAHLHVHLDQVQAIVRRALDTVDRSIDELEPVLKEASKPTPRNAAERVRNLLPGND